MICLDFFANLDCHNPLNFLMFTIPTLFSCCCTPLNCSALQLFAGVLAERANMSLPDLTMMMVRVADAKMVERFREAVLSRAGDLD